MTKLELAKAIVTKEADALENNGHIHQVCPISLRSHYISKEEFIKSKTKAYMSSFNKPVLERFYSERVAN